MKINFFAGLLLAFLIGAQPVAAQTPATDQHAAFDAICQALFPADGPGGTVLVAKGDQILYQKAFGLDDLNARTPIRTDMVFRIGSVTKQFTAIAILQLVQQGKVSLDDEITRFIPDYPTHGKKITVENLLTHTSGIKSYTSMDEWTPEVQQKDFTPAALIDFFKDQPMDFDPGTQYAYSNSGYILLGYIIEKVSGMPYADYLAKKVFKRAGLKHTFYENQPRPIAGWAQGYMQNEHGYVPAPPLSMTQPYAAGSLASTVEDLYRWTRAVHGGKLVPADLLKKAHTPHILPDGENTHYGYGWVLGNIWNSPTIEHNGGIHGFLSSLIYMPKEAVCVAVLSNCNCHSPDETAAQLAAVAAGYPAEMEAVPVDASTLASYAGVYENDQQAKRIIRTSDDGGLISERIGGKITRLTPVGRDKFRFDGSLIAATFLRDDKTGEVTGIILDTRTMSGERWTKTGAAPPAASAELQLSEEQLQRLVGEYSLAPGFSITVTREGTHLFGQGTGQSRFEMFAKSELRFFLKVVSAEIEFFPDEKGAIGKMVLYQGGQAIPGERVK